MKIAFPQELRAEAAAAAAKLKTVITSAREAGAQYLVVLGRKDEVDAQVTALARNPGQLDPVKIVTAWEKELEFHHPDGEPTRLVKACEATHAIQIKLWNFARAQISAVVKKAVQPFFTAATLEHLPFTTELENGINILAMRLRLSQAANFVDALRLAELTHQVLADLAADRDVFALPQTEVPAAA